MTIEPDFACEHVLAEGAAAPEGAVEIDVDDVEPMLVGDRLGRRLAAGDAGIVDEDVDLAVARRRARSATSVTRLESVTSMIDDLGVVGLSPSGSARPALGDLGVAVGDDDLGAGLGQRLDAGEPDALAAAGHDGGLAARA